MKRIGGFRRKTRYRFVKAINKRGKISLTRYLQEFNPGEKVALVIESSVTGGMFHPRFYGKVGTIKEKRGECYEVTIYDHKKEKTLIVHPIHMRKN